LHAGRGRIDTTAATSSSKRRTRSRAGQPDPWYQYFWDDVGRLARATHQNLSGAFVADQIYTSDSDGNRVRTDNILAGRTSTAFVFDRLVVKNLSYSAATQTWSPPTAGSTDVYLSGGRPGCSSTRPARCRTSGPVLRTCRTPSCG
jgi:hypothetical protein